MPHPSPFPITRFAPSPTGYLHLGHAHSALFGWRQAMVEADGRFIVRVEDIDAGRCREEFVAALLEDLAWLGLCWDTPVRRQSQHMAEYQVALERLTALNVIYPCFCTRKDIAHAGHAPHGPDGPLYPGTCRTLSASQRVATRATGQPYALRLDVAAALRLSGPLFWHDRAAGTLRAQPEILGDVVLARKDTPTSYHLSVTVDDHLQGITLVTRGVDLFHATHIHRLLQALLGLETPEYHHHPLLTNPAGQRLAKRDGAMALRALRVAGYSATAVRAMAGFPDSPEWSLTQSAPHHLVHIIRS